MKIENERIEKLVHRTQELVERGSSVLGGRQSRTGTSTDTGVIYGNTVSGSTPVFSEQKTSVAEIQAEASGMNVRQTKDTMALLSNTMTEKDYAEFMKNGGNIHDTDIDTIVTVVDKIQISLAAGSGDYQGYAGDISRETLEKLEGNTQLAYAAASALKEQDLPVTDENVTGVVEAVSMAEGLEPVAESTALYLLQNKLEPTIENMYLAQHSTGNQMLGAYGQEFFTRDDGKYYAKIGAGREYSGMSQRMDEIIANAGLEVNEDTREAAKWMVEHQVPLTEENMRLADRISEVTIPQETKKLVESIVNTIAQGQKPVKAPLTTDDNYVRRSEEVVETLSKAGQEEVKSLILAKKPITVENLQEEMEAPSADGTILRDGDVRVVSAMRQLEELRLKMTLESSVRMMQKGIQVETTELSDLVEQLRSLEEEGYKNMLQGQKIEETQENLDLLSAVSIRTQLLPTLPVAVLGNVLKENVVPTMDQLCDRGQTLKSAYERAGETYEALGTMPRRDLGDSIQKAFENTDSLLEEIGMEATEENRRGVRILGYNSMEITRENLTEVKQMDGKVQYLMKNLTPSVTLEMVREGVNPLNKPLDEVNREIDRIRQDQNLTREDDYSRFLWKMEQNDQITEQERDAYVGIYRLLHQVEKNDGAAIGSLAAQGGELTLQNLLTGIRSRKGQNMDIRIDDGFGATESYQAPENSISAQIDRGFSGNENNSGGTYQKQLASQILDAIAPEKLAEVSDEKDVWEMNLEELLDAMRQTDSDEELDSRYAREELQRMADSRSMEERVIAQMEANEIPMTYRNMWAMEGILQGGGQFFRQLLKLDSEGKEGVEETLDRMLEAAGSEEELQEACAGLEEKAKALTEPFTSGENLSSVDVRAMKTLNSQFRILGQLSRQEQYFLPLETDEGVAGVHLTILHQREEQGKVQVSMETESLGMVKAEFLVSSQRISGYVAADSEEGLEKLKAGEESLLEELGQMKDSVQVEYLKQEKLEWFKPGKNEGEKTHTAQLYKVAKGFLENLQSLV